MDVKREGIIEARRRRQILYSIVGVLVVAVISAWLWQLEPAPPTIPRSSVYLGVVERGEMLRQVRGPGTLVPVEIRWISSQTEGRVERRVVLPGAHLEPDTVILELSNPELRQSLLDAELRLRQAEADFEDRKVELESRLLNEKAAFAEVQSEYRQAALQAEANQELVEQGLIPELEAKISDLRADELANRTEIEKERIAISRKSVVAKLNSEQARLQQARALHGLRVAQVEALHVRSGIRGVLQELPVEEGQQVTAGFNLARVAKPDRLKAELRIAETQAKDVEVGQYAAIDTRNGIIEGRVERIDPAVQNGSVTVDVALQGELPRGARPDLSVDGTVQLERLTDVLYVGRPAYGQAHSLISLYKIDPNGDTATRSQVQLGRTSVTTVEIVEGLLEGDRVILSDTSQWEDFDRVRLGS